MNYTPHKKQALFHDDANSRFRVVRGGNRSGKSLLGTAEACAFALGTRWWNGSVASEKPTKGMIVSSDWQASQEIFTNQGSKYVEGKLFQLLPSNRISQINKNRHGFVTKLEVIHDSGGLSTIYLESAEEWEQEKHRGDIDLDWAFFDELPPEEMFKSSIRQLLDRNGKLWMAYTDTEVEWFNNLWHKLNNTHFLTMSIYDNPHIPKEAVEAYVKLLPENEVEARVHGQLA